MGEARSGHFGSPGLRLLQLFILLSSSRRAYSLTRLAGLFRCSRQTIGRLVEQLALAPGVEIETWIDRRERYYRLAPTRTPGAVSFTPDTLHYVALCRDVLRHILPDAVQDELSGFLGAATEDGASGSAAGEGPMAEPWLKGRIDYRPFEPMLEDIQTPMRERRLCRVDYRARSRGACRSYVIAPLRIVAYREALYVLCRKHTPAGPGDYHTLAVQRMRNLRLCRETFTDTLPRDREEHFGFPFHEPITVRALFRGPAADYVAERIWSRDQKQRRRRDGTLELTFTATSRLEVMAWILSFGPDAELLTPQDLREELREKAAAICAVYDESASAQGAQSLREGEAETSSPANAATQR
jgi:predicted DNA-binding transcriptional regulator YafY